MTQASRLLYVTCSSPCEQQREANCIQRAGVATVTSYCCSTASVVMASRIMSQCFRVCVRVCVFEGLLVVPQPLNLIIQDAKKIVFLVFIRLLPFIVYYLIGFPLFDHFRHVVQIIYLNNISF